MQIPIEYFGTAASVVVAFSLTQKNIRKLRILNLTGAAAFAVYGFLIRAWPVFGLNAFITIIDIFYLVQMFMKKDYFKLMKIEHPEESGYLKEFLDFYMADINAFMPDFRADMIKGSEAVFILRDMMPASVVIYRRDRSTVNILADYAVPAYRDGKNSRFFFEKLKETLGRGTEYISKPGSARHNSYLESMGFRQDGNGSYVSRD